MATQANLVSLCNSSGKGASVFPCTEMREGLASALHPRQTNPVCSEGLDLQQGKREDRMAAVSNPSLLPLPHIQASVPVSLGLKALPGFYARSSRSAWDLLSGV